MICVLLIIFILYFISFIVRENYYYRNKNYFKHNYKEYDDFISKETCYTFKQKIVNNIHFEDNPLNDSFKNTKGILIEFTDKNDYNAFQSKNLEFLYPYYKKIKKPYANHFIFNILAIPPSKKKKMSIGYHYDSTLSLNEIDESYFSHDIVPECVSVTYIAQPKHMKDGKLQLIKYGNWINVGNITPSIGKMVEFNGKLYHGVESFYDLDNSNTYRISLVLEQYCV